MDTVIIAAEVLVGDGSQDMGVDSSKVLVGAPGGEGVVPIAVVDGLQDFGEVLVGNVENGKGGFIVLVDNELLVKRNRLVVTLLEEKGDWPERYEFRFPVGSALTWWWRWLQIAKGFLVDEGARKFRLAAFLYDRIDHVSVSGSFVPQSPEAVEFLIELDKVGVDVGSVGGGEGKTDPGGSST